MFYLADVLKECIKQITLILICALGFPKEIEWFTYYRASMVIQRVKNLPAMYQFSSVAQSCPTFYDP